MAKREITRQADKDTSNTIAGLEGMTNEEKQLFFEVIKGSIVAINSQTPLGRIGQQERLFRSYSRTALDMAMMFVQEYRGMKTVSRRSGDTNG